MDGFSDADPIVVAFEETLAAIDGCDDTSPDLARLLSEASASLEFEEAAFEEQVGDPHDNPTLRGFYRIGSFLEYCRDYETLLDRCAELMQNRQAALPLKAAAARYLLSVLGCIGLNWPLTDETFADFLYQNAVEQSPPFRLASDPPPSTMEDFHKEQLATYTLGLLAIALLDEISAEDAVRKGMVVPLARFLRRAIDAHPTLPSVPDPIITKSGALSAPLSGEGGAGGEAAAVAAGGAAAPQGHVSTALPEETLSEVRVVRRQRERHALQCLALMGAYVESLGPVLTELGAETMVALLKRHVPAGGAAGPSSGPSAAPAAASPGPAHPTSAPNPSTMELSDVLGLMVTLSSHRRFAELFVEAGGLQQLLSYPRTPHTYLGISLLLCALSNFPGAFNRALGLQRETPDAVVAAAMQLLHCSREHARINAASFFRQSLILPSIVDSFERHEGARKLLNLVRVGLSAAPRERQTAAEIKQERQLREEVLCALRQYIRAAFVQSVSRWEQRFTPMSPLQGSQPKGKAAGGQREEPIDVSTQNVRRAMGRLESDRKLAIAVLRSRLPALEHLVELGAPILLVEIAEADTRSDKNSTEEALYALESLQPLALLASARRQLVKGPEAAPGGAAGPGTAAEAAAAAANGAPSRVAISAGAGQPRAPKCYLAALVALSGNTEYLKQCPEIPYMALKVIALCSQPLPCLVGPTEAQSQAQAAREAAANANSTAPGPQPGQEPGSAPAHAPTPPPANQEAAGTQAWLQSLESGFKAAREAIRANNGIKVTLSLLQSQHIPPGPSLAAIRAAACRVLLGLARDPVIRHILSKLQLSRILTEQLRDPGPGFGAGEGRGAGTVVHTGPSGDVFGPGPGGAAPGDDLTRAALELLSQVNAEAGGQAAVAPQELLTLNRMQRAQIAASASITYNPKELLTLIHDHLSACGLGESAAVLAREAGLGASGAKQAAGGIAQALAAAAATAVQQQQQQNAAAAATALAQQQQVLDGSLVARIEAVAAAAASAAPAQVEASGMKGAGPGPGFLGNGAAPDAAPGTGRRLGFSQRVQQTLGSKLPEGGIPITDPNAGTGVAPVAPPPPSTTPIPEGHVTPLALSFPGSPPVRPIRELLERDLAPEADGTSLIGLASTAPSRPAPALTTASLPLTTDLLAAMARNTGQRGGVKRPRRDRPEDGVGAAAAAGQAAGPRGSSPTFPQPGPAPAQGPVQDGAGAAAEPGQANEDDDDIVAGPFQQGQTPFHLAPPAGPPPLTGPALKKARLTAGPGPSPRMSSGAGGLLGPGAAGAAAGQASAPTGPAPQQHGHGHSSVPPPSPVSLFAPGTITGQRAGVMAQTAPRPPSRAGPAQPRTSQAAANVDLAAEPSSARHDNTLNRASAPPHPTAALPLLLDMPSAGNLILAGKEAFCPTQWLQSRMTVAITEAASRPPPVISDAVFLEKLRSQPAASTAARLRPHVVASARDEAKVHSRLDAIVRSHLRQQHRQACIQARQPVAVIPPMSLLRPHTLPEASRAFDAPWNIQARLARRESLHPFGGPGGRSLFRRFKFSRFRPRLGCREREREDRLGVAKRSVATTSAFISSLNIIVTGNNVGELKSYDSRRGELLEVYADAHSGESPVLDLDVRDLAGGAGGGAAAAAAAALPGGAASLLLSSTREEVKLWDLRHWEDGAQLTLAGVRSGVFDPSGARFGCLTSALTRAQIHDTLTGQEVAALDLEMLSGMAPDRHPRAFQHLAFHPEDPSVVLWGASLWDIRSRNPVHRFDVFSDLPPAGVFHPAAPEVILNSEVWDVRTLRLIRSVPALDHLQLTFSPDRGALYGWLRRHSEEVAAVLAPRRARHPLNMAFAVFDGTSYEQIACVPVDRVVVDLSVDQAGTSIAVCCVDQADITQSLVKVFDVGRSRRQPGLPPGADSDLSESSGGEGGEEEDEMGDEDDLEAAILDAPELDEEMIRDLDEDEFLDELEEALEEVEMEEEDGEEGGGTSGSEADVTDGGEGEEEGSGSEGESEESMSDGDPERGIVVDPALFAELIGAAVADSSSSEEEEEESGEEGEESGSDEGSGEEEGEEGEEGEASSSSSGDSGEEEEEDEE